MSAGALGGGLHRLVCFMGADDTAYFSDLDFLCRSGRRREVAAAVLAELAAARGEFDAVCLPRMPLEGDGPAAVMEAAAAAGFRVVIEDFIRTAWDRLPRRFGEFLRRMPHAGRRRCWRNFPARLLERHPDARFEDASGEPAEALMDELRDVQCDHWRHRGHAGYFSNPHWPEFGLRMWRNLQRRGRLRVRRLVIGGRTAALELGAAYRGTYFGLHRTRRPEFDGIGVGHGLLAHVVARSIAEGLERIDFFDADHYAYKREFLSRTRLTGTVTLFDDRPAAGLRQGLRLMGRAVAGGLT